MSNRKAGPKGKRMGKNLSLRPLKFREAVSDILKVKPEPRPKPTHKASEPKWV